ncbi:ABC transporter ATP-binding protein [Cellvibrio japonicus]|uniref:ABC transporter, ATP-binding protein n=1 Tax=Cellvibrio japonicus (strain Ueda107) TaxID=498211 RepID=B3PE44_CELJU|nr:ABC transporter ATP-binding protein [Cellvibrio japonicus]ACE83345.1 ABC transporter, ATP-binding protein [Cellvibrio japonicus Ueda107]QEI12091.1 ABC transporter ATP-binding protein [Cellvibrio japonicus]QEI15665.1 ABC transporter ATP-binding protein [Cellvibrio japonicus]QEI19243.1 ABC transporter ATP-binding protein [Cellvibrio japonicus]
MSTALAVEQLCKVYGSGLEALKGISLDVMPGDFFAILGPNGAGKSTLIGIISSLVRKTSGRVRIFDTDIDDNFSRAKQLLGVVPQEFNFSVFEKVEDIVLQQAGYYGLPRAQAQERTRLLLQQLSLWDKRDTPARMLSGGMKRRLMIARALVHNPQLLILDEPTAGVDIELRRSMWDFLREINQQGTTIILTTHYLEEAESLCRNVAIIDHGTIVQNTSVKSLLQQLNKEVFIFDVKGQLPHLPVLHGYNLVQLDDHSFEVEVVKGQSLNAVFAQLTEQQIDIVSMRNKANRLEELFVAMVNANKHVANPVEARS